MKRFLCAWCFGHFPAFWRQLDRDVNECWCGRAEVTDMEIANRWQPSWKAWTRFIQRVTRA